MMRRSVKSRHSEWDAPSKSEKLSVSICQCFMFHTCLASLNAPDQSQSECYSYDCCLQMDTSTTPKARERTTQPHATSIFRQHLSSFSFLVGELDVSLTPAGIYTDLKTVVSQAELVVDNKSREEVGINQNV